jgi:uncharacterized protein YeaC (DUF1315 family)
MDNEQTISWARPDVIDEVSQIYQRLVEAIEDGGW